MKKKASRRAADSYGQHMSGQAGKAMRATKKTRQRKQKALDSVMGQIRSTRKK